MSAIQNLQESWEGHSFAEIEAFVKSQFRASPAVMTEIDLVTDDYFQDLSESAAAAKFGVSEETLNKIIDCKLPILRNGGQFLYVQFQSRYVNSRSVYLFTLVEEGMHCLGILIKTESSNLWTYNEI